MIRPRLRFETFKRDSFTCQYCGKGSPSVVLEVDHIVPVCEGGTDDPINLRTSCWECNRGKSGVPLSEVVTGEDPHDQAVMLLERERQLREYNAVLSAINQRVEADTEHCLGYWEQLTGRTLYGADLTSLENALSAYPAERVLRAMSLANRARKTSSLAYVHACLNNWAKENAPAQRQPTKSRAPRSGVYSEAFNRFWDAYPRKTGKGAAWKAFKALSVGADLLQTMVEALIWQRTQPSWTKDNGQYIPHASTWLNQRRWEDEPFHAPAKATVHDGPDWFEECQQLHHGACNGSAGHRVQMLIDAERGK